MLTTCPVIQRPVETQLAKDGQVLQVQQMHLVHQKVQQQMQQKELQQEVSIPDILRSDRLDTKLEFTGGASRKHSRLNGRDMKPPDSSKAEGKLIQKVTVRQLGSGRAVSAAATAEGRAAVNRWLEMRSRLAGQSQTADLLRDRNQRLRRNLLELDNKLGNRQKWAETVLLLRDIDKNNKRMNGGEEEEEGKDVEDPRHKDERTASGESRTAFTDYKKEISVESAEKAVARADDITLPRQRGNSNQLESNDINSYQTGEQRERHLAAGEPRQDEEPAVLTTATRHRSQDLNISETARQDSSRIDHF